MDIVVKNLSGVLLSFDAFKALIERSKQISINTNQVVYNLSVDANYVDLNWADEDGDRFHTKVERRFNEGKMFLESDGEIVAYDSDGDIDRIQCYAMTLPLQESLGIK